MSAFQLTVLVGAVVYVIALAVAFHAMSKTHRKLVSLVNMARGQLDAVAGELQGDVRSRLDRLEQVLPGIEAQLGSWAGRLHGIEEAGRTSQEHIERSVEELRPLVERGSARASEVLPGSRLHQVAVLNSLQLSSLASRAKLMQAEDKGGLAPVDWSLSSGRRRSRRVLFLHNSYYHFYYLAQALRERGWDAATVSIEDPGGVNAPYYHGEDLNIFSPDPAQLQRNIQDLFEESIRRFDLVHFAGDGMLAFFPQNFAKAEPEDILEWKARGKKVAYTVSGCNSCVRQTSVAQWSRLDGRTVCDTCIWQNRPDVCADDRNLQWGKKVDSYCDVIFGETLPALDYLDSPRAIREPVTMCVDPNIWHPSLAIPEGLRIDKKPGEVLVYHSMGNFELRARKRRNIKGTPAILEAVDRLQSEGVNVRLHFVTGQKNLYVKYAQVQSDIIVDQLNIGRYGANSREAMMLGKPTICYTNRNEMKPEQRLRSVGELPLISATPETLYGVLRELVLDPGLRARVGEESRRFALKWHSPRTCAARYECLYDAMMAGVEDLRQVAMDGGEADEFVASGIGI